VKKIENIGKDVDSSLQFTFFGPPCQLLAA